MTKKYRGKLFIKKDKRLQAWRWLLINNVRFTDMGYIEYDFYLAESFSGKIESGGTAIVDLYHFVVIGRNEIE